MIEDKKYTIMKRKMEKYRSLSVKRLAMIEGLKPYVSRKVWDMVLDEVNEYKPEIKG